MKPILAAVGIAILLHATSTVAQTTTPEPALNVLAAQERAELRSRYRSAESDKGRNTVRAEMRERVRSQEMLNRELPPAYRDQLTTQEQRQIRDQLQNANGSFARQGVVKQAQSMAQNRIQTRTQNTQRIQTQQRFKTRAGGQNPNTPRWGSSGTSGANSGSASGGSWGGGTVIPRDNTSSGSAGGGRR